MKTIQISEETYETIKDQLVDEVPEDNIDNIEDLIGRKYLFRTVTYFLVGKVQKCITDDFTCVFLKLTNASWVADTGRFMNCIKNGTLEEVEPVGVAYINMGSVVDFFPWKHKLPTEQK